jgi:hypothetical protein
MVEDFFGDGNLPPSFSLAYKFLFGIFDLDTFPENQYKRVFIFRKLKMNGKKNSLEVAQDENSPKASNLREGVL